MQILYVKHQIADHLCIFRPGNIHQSRLLSQRKQTSYCDIFINSGTKRMQLKSESKINQRGRTQHLQGKLPEPTVGSWMRIHKLLCCEGTLCRDWFLKIKCRHRCRIYVCKPRPWHWSTLGWIHFKPQLAWHWSKQYLTSEVPPNQKLPRNLCLRI